MVIDVLASQPNYWRHLAPIVAELRARGHEVRSFSTRGGRSWGPPIQARRETAPVAVCAAWIDARRVRDTPTVYVEHGAGQSYVDGSGDGYAGADGLDHVRLFVCPGEHVAQRWRQRYPATPAIAVGCAALDQHFFRFPDRDRGSNRGMMSHPCATPSSSARRAVGAQVPRDASGRPLVAITSHWRCGVVPETKPALPRYLGALREVLEADTWEVLGHGHPRDERRNLATWKRLGVEHEPDPDVVLARLVARGGVLVADNTSLLYEAAALDVPVVVLNAPWYRRDVEHGLRFWSHVPGVQCDEPTEFRGALEDADHERWRAVRADASAHVYAAVDGQATQRAVDAIESVI